MIIIVFLLLAGCFWSVVQIDTLIPAKIKCKESNINTITFSKCILPYKEN